MRLRVNEVKLSNVHTFKRPILHPPTLELPFGKVKVEEVYTVLGLETFASTPTDDNDDNESRRRTTVNNPSPNEFRHLFRNHPRQSARTKR